MVISVMNFSSQSKNNQTIKKNRFLGFIVGGSLLRQFKSEVQQVLMMTARILHSECDSQAIFLVDY
jgi:hypothetical protein